MPEESSNGNGEQKTWAEWKQELFQAIDSLDRACANARQIIYRLRPLVRPKNYKREEQEEGSERAVALDGRRRYRRDRS